MGQYAPRTVSELASTIEDICEALRADGGKPLSTELKQALAKRVIELFDNGITDPDQLRIGVVADRLWASSRSTSI